MHSAWGFVMRKPSTNYKFLIDSLQNVACFNKNYARKINTGGCF